MATNHWDTLLNHCVARARELEKSAFDSSDQILSDIGLTSMPPLFIATADLRTGIYYAPVSNISYSKLLGVPAGRARAQSPKRRREVKQRTLALSFLAFMRNLFPAGGPAKDGPLSQIAGEVARESRLVLYRVKGRSIGEGIVLKQDDTTEQLAEKGSELGKGTIDGIEWLQKSLRGDPWLCFVDGGDVTCNWAPHRSYTLVQIGIVFRSSNSIEELKACRIASKISQYGAISLLSERERYYHLALRQAARGTIVKYGPRESIAPQVSTLKALDDGHVPWVEDEGDQQQPYTWYTMPRFRLISLRDLFAQVDGFDDFEVRSIASGCFRHLETTYWRPKTEPLVALDFSVRELLTTSAILATKAAVDCITAVREQANDIAKRKPVQLDRGVMVLDPKSVKLYRRFLKDLDDPRGFSIEVKWPTPHGKRPKAQKATRINLETSFHD